MDGTTNRKRQIGLEEALLVEKKLKLDRQLSKAMFYQGNVSLGIFEENKHLKEVFQELAGAAGLAGYVPPSRYRMATEMLDFHYDELSTKIKGRLLSSGSYVTASFDGWDNASRTHLLGVSAITKSGALFHSSIDTTGVDFMGKEWTLSQVRTVVEALGGVTTVVAVVLDSPSVNTSALQAYEKEQPTVACCLCTCHIISLFLQDVFKKIEEVGDLSRIVHQISKKFRNVKWLRDHLAKKQSTLPLKVYHSITRP